MGRCDLFWLGVDECDHFLAGVGGCGWIWPVGGCDFFLAGCDLFVAGLGWLWVSVTFLARCRWVRVSVTFFMMGVVRCG